MSFTSRLISRLMHLPPAQTRKLAIAHDIPIPMPDGVVLLKEPIMTNTPISIFISSARVDSVFVAWLAADLLQRGRWSSQVWNVLCLLRQEVLHA